MNSTIGLILSVPHWNKHDFQTRDQKVVTDIELPLEALPAFGFVYRPAVQHDYKSGSEECLHHHREKGLNPTIVRWQEGVKIYRRRLPIEQKLAGKEEEKFVKLSELMKYIIAHHRHDAATDVKLAVEQAVEKTLSKF